MTLARPETRNAFDAALIAELAEAFVDVGRARAVVLAGDGPSFSAGADVDWMRASADLSLEENVADANALRKMLEAIDGCLAPVVARVQGHALGGGAGLVAASDIAIAARDAVFAFSEVKLGIIPAVISPFALAKIGPGAARRYFVTGERFDAETALRIGLVHEVADDLDAARRPRRRRAALGRPAGGALGEAARARAAGRAGDRTVDRRAAHERRGPGGAARVPREAQAELARVVMPVRPRLAARDGAADPPTVRRRRLRRLPRDPYRRPTSSGTCTRSRIRRLRRRAQSLRVRIAGAVVSEEGQWLSAAATLRETGELVADIVLKWESIEHRQGEIGYIVHPAHKGHGYAAEASLPILRFGFETLGLHRIVGRLDARNEASARVPEKLGLRREAHLVENEFVKGEWTSEPSTRSSRTSFARRPRACCPRDARRSTCPGSRGSPASGRAASAARRRTRASSPSPSGAHGMNAMPSSVHASSTSSEMSSPRLNWFWTETIVRHRLGLAQLLEREVRDADHPDLPLVAELLERADRLLERHLGIVAVQLVQVDPLELQPAQARLARLAQMLGPAVADPVLQSPAEPALRRDDEPVRIRVQRLGDDLLADAPRRRCRRCR